MPAANPRLANPPRLLPKKKPIALVKPPPAAEPEATEPEPTEAKKNKKGWGHELDRFLFGGKNSDDESDEESEDDDEEDTDDEDDDE